MPDYRSVSQVKQYEECPYRYYLDRIERVWKRPAAWLPHGTAVHAAVEAYEKSGRTMTAAEAQDVFRKEYSAGINEMTEDTPNFNYWFSSGRYRGREDTERRYLKGLEMVEAYVDYAQAHEKEAIWITPAGEPAIELKFDIDLDGVQMVGYIDQVITKPGYPAFNDAEGHVRVRDIKTGANPGDDFQLKVYSVAIEQEHGVTADVGDYWMGKAGKPTKPYDLTRVSRQEVVDRVHAADEGIREERFDPKPDPDTCRRCDVATACKYAV